MDKDTRFAILVIGIPFLGLAYCGLIFAVMIYWVWGREHPVTMATFFVLAPSLISGSIWLLASYKARQKQRLGLWLNVEADDIRSRRINMIKNDRLHLKTYD